MRQRTIELTGDDFLEIGTDDITLQPAVLITRLEAKQMSIERSAIDSAARLCLSINKGEEDDV